MKKFFTLLIVFLLWATSSWAQVTIGNGSVNNLLPINAYYGYTYSQNIYLSSDINASGPITTLSFYFAGTSLTSSNNWTIYIGHTTKTAFNTTTDWIPVSAMTQVYSGTFTSPTGPGWLLFDITDFTYNGTDNLVIAVDENTSGYNGSGDYFYTTNATTNRAIRYYADGTNPDPLAPPTGTQVMAYPNVILGGITMTPCALPNLPTALSVSPVTYTSTALAGTFTASSPAATGYVVVRYPTGSATTAPVNGNAYAAGNALGLGTVVYSGPLTTFQDAGLTPNTTYDYYIYPYNNTGCGPRLYNLTTPLYAFGHTNTVQNSPSTAIGGLWSSPATWVSGIVPTGENAVIAAGAVVTVDAAVNVSGLVVNGTLQWGSSSYAATIKNDLVINIGGKFLPYTTGATGQSINIGGNFTNDGYANLAVSGTLINFNGSQQTSSLNQTLGGFGTFQGDGPNGIIRALFFQTTGTCTISASLPQNLIVSSDFAHTAGSLNTNGKLSIDNTAQVYGQALNNQVANVAVTTMGAGYTAAPVVFGNTVLPWPYRASVSSGSRYFYGNNVYLCTTTGIAGSVPPTSNATTTFADSTSTLLYIGTLGTLGNPYITGAYTVGTQYFYDNRLYVAVATTASGTTPPTHTTGVVGSLLYVGTPAQVSVNWDATNTCVRSLTLITPGSGYISTAPALVFSKNQVTTPGTSASATVVFLQQIAGPANSRTQKGTVSSISGGLNIVSNQAVGGITTSNGGLNYSAAPLVGFPLPNNINLVTAQGSAYTANPTVTISGGTNINSGTLPTITLVTAGGKVVSAYVTSNGTALWSVPPTVALSGSGGTGATVAFPAGCLPTATATVTNGSITGFTITNAGYGYDAAPTPGLFTVGTVTTAASTPSCRIGLYNLVYNYYTPATTNPAFTEGAEVPANRRINAINYAPGVIATFTGNLELYASTPILSTLTNAGLISLGTNTLTFSHRSYAGQSGSTSFGFNGTLTLTSPGGSVTRTFPFDAAVAVATGTGSAAAGSTITTLTASRYGAPTGSGSPKGTRTYRIQTNGGAYGTAPTVTLNWNNFDALITDNNSLLVSQSTGTSGPWTARSIGSGGTTPIGATGSRTTATATPGPITTDEYFAWSSAFVPPPGLSYKIERTTAESYSSIMSTGTPFVWSSVGNIDDNHTNDTPMPSGSTFTFQGETITGFQACTNGWLKLNSANYPATSSNDYYTGLGVVGIPMMISVFHMDLICGTTPTNNIDDHIRYKVLGTTAGSRKIVVEWFNLTTYGAQGPQLSWQVVLDESDNSVKINYGLFQGFNGTNNMTYGYNVGLVGRYVSSPPQPGEILAQQYENSDAFSNNFVNTSSYYGANRLMSIPECNSAIKFTPGTYGGLVVPTPTPPVNDDPANAITVAALSGFPANLCGNFYTSRFATPSAQAVCHGDAADDVWFKFVCVEPSTTVRVYGSGGYQASAQAFDNNLNPLPTPVCVTATAGGTSVDANLNNLSPGQTYYIRIYHDGGGVQATGIASINAVGQVTGVTMTNVGSGYTTTTSGTSSPRVRFTGGGGYDAVGYANFTGNTISSISMGNNGYGYTSAPTVYIESPSWAQIGEFALVVYASSPNDDCANAVALTGLQTPGCTTGTNSRTYNTMSATPSADAVVCGLPDDDVWYKFVAVDTLTKITVSGTGTFDPAFQVFDDNGAGNCTGKTSVACINVYSGTTTESVLQHTTIGHTYYVRVYHAGTGSAIGSNFTICVSSSVPACVIAPVAPLNNGNACEGTVTLSWAAVDGATSYDVYLNTGLGLTIVSPAQTGLTFTTAALTAGSYSWKVIPKNNFGAATGCNEFSFTIHNTPNIVVEPTSANYCPNDNPVTFQSGGAATYAWLPTGGLNIATGHIVQASPGASTVYTVTGTDTYGCTASATATVNVNPIITATASANPMGICLHGSTVLTASATTPNGSYCVPTITGYGGLTEDEIDNVTFAGINNNTGDGPGDYNYYNTMTATCVAGTVYPFSLTTGTVFDEQLAIFIDYNQDGTFDASEEVFATTSSVASASGNITVPTSAFNGVTRMRVVCRYSTAIDATMSCTFNGWGEYEDYNVNISGATTPPPAFVATFNWGPGGMTGSPVTVTNIGATTTYTVVASAQGYCPGSATVTVTVDPLVCGALTTTGATTCVGTQTLHSNVTGGGLPYTYVWTENGLPFGGNTASILPSAGTHTYVCHVTDACNNTCSSSLSVTTAGVPNVAVTPNTSNYCTPAGTPVMLTASGALQYDWTPSSGLDTYSGSIVNASPSATTVYTVNGTDVFGCSASATATITSVTTLIVTASANPTSTCLNGSTILSATASDGSTTYCIPTVPDYGAEGDYLNNFTFANLTNNNSGDASSNYTYYNTLTANVVADGTTPYAISCQAGGTASYYADNFGIWIDYNQNGTFEPTEFVWASTTATYSPSFSLGSITIPNTAYNGVTRMRVAAKYYNVVTAADKCSFITGYDGEYEDYNVSITGGTPPPAPMAANFTWTPGGVTGSPVNISPIAATTTYTVTASASGFCNGVATVTVTVAPLACTGLTVGGANNCVGTQNLTVGVNGGGLPYTYVWTEDGLPFGGNTATIITTAGTHHYVCTVHDVCSNTCVSTADVSTDPLPVVAVTPNPGVYCTPGGTAAVLTASGADAFAWTPSTGLNVTNAAVVNANPTGSTTYTVTGTTGACSASTSVAVTVGPNLTMAPTVTPALPDSIAYLGTGQLFANMGQVMPAFYNFTYNTGAALDPMIGATTVINTGDDDTPTAAAADLGFTFNFNGTSYTKYSVSPDGWIMLGNGTASASYGNGVTLATNIPKIYPYWDDLATGTDGHVKVLTEGVAPDRIFKVEWFVTIPRNTGGAANSHFQAWLYENGGAIEFRYGHMGPQTAGSASAGLTGSPATSFKSITFATHTVSSGTANDNNAGVPDSSAMYTFAPPVPVVEWTPTTFLSSNTELNPMVLDAYVTTTYTVTATVDGCASTGVITANVEQPVTRDLDLRVFLEGFYNSSTGFLNEVQGIAGPEFPGYADQVSVEFHDATPPYDVHAGLVYTGLNLGVDGYTVVTYNGKLRGSYYVVVKHRNSIETWTADPVDFNDPIPTSLYDFTTSSSMAYGNNMKDVMGVYVFWSGDVTQDGLVDGSDLAAVDNASLSVLMGYNPEDVNGDGLVDGSDMALIDNNSLNVIQSMRP